MIRPLLLLFFILNAFYSLSQDTPLIKTYPLGKDSVSTYTTCFSSCDSGIVFIQLHEDETTAIEAAQEYFTENGGYLIQLKHTGKRLVTFKFRNHDFIIDPNRIFTRTGLKNNMAKLKEYHYAAASHVTRLAGHILKSHIDNKKLVIALHNNTEDRFSVLSYTKGKPEALNASKVYINKSMDPDDFMLTTDTSIYRKIKEKNINVVLQSKRAKDDGSLSVYTQRKNIPYINIEAQHGHLEEQRNMLWAIKDIIAVYQDIIELNYMDNKK